ncbi:MAG: hypothetical protein AAB631_02430 [Patescibacteria group bacterium]
MNHGKWYLVYSWNDTFGGGLGGTWEDKEIPLKAITEDEAIAEAKSKWEEKVVEAKANWEVQRKTWVHPPASPFTDGPTNPRVIYKISLQ